MDPTEQLVLCDLDGTLASSQWRDHLVEGPIKRYAEFYKGIPFDNVVPKVKALLEEKLAEGCRIVYITAREEYVDETKTKSDGTKEKLNFPIKKWTQDWLTKHSAPGWPSEAVLLMRKHKDHRQAAEVKEEMLMKYLGGNKTNNVVLALDDNEHVIGMYKKHGIQNAMLVSDPGVTPALQQQHDDFVKQLPVARLLMQAAAVLETRQTQAVSSSSLGGSKRFSNSAENNTLVVSRRLK